MAKLGRINLTDRATRGIQLLASHLAQWKPIGITLDWSKVAAVAGADVTLVDETVIAVGDKFLRYGQILVPVTATGLYGPYDPAAADGRQLLVKGQAVALNETLILSERGYRDEEHFGALLGGVIWRPRLIQSGVGAHSLAAGPTQAEVDAVFNFTYVD